MKAIRRTIALFFVLGLTAMAQMSPADKEQASSGSTMPHPFPYQWRGSDVCGTDEHGGRVRTSQASNGKIPGPARGGSRRISDGWR
jgi:hypothetical protein